MPPAGHAAPVTNVGGPAVSPAYGTYRSPAVCRRPRLPALRGTARAQSASAS